MSGTDNGIPAVAWRIEQRAGEFTATNEVTGEVWQSSSLFAVCMAVAAGGNDLHAPAKWLRFLSEWTENAAEAEDDGVNIPDAPTNTNGELIERHVARCHVGNGEMTLCERYIGYSTFVGFAPDAVGCARCSELDC